MIHPVLLFTALEWRLFGGTLPNEGRLEVRLQQPDTSVWHTICSDAILDHVPKLICADLGWPVVPLPCSKTISPTSEPSVTGLGEIVTFSADCQIDVASLSECDFNFQDASGTCQHEDDAWISCLAGVNIFVCKLNKT